MSFIHVFGNLAFILVACSFMVKDIVWLRLLSITASLCSIVYNSNVAATPLLVPISWNLFFISLNIYHVGKIIYGNRTIKLSKKELELYQMSFSQLNLNEFKKLIRMGEWKEVEANTKIITENQSMEDLMMIYNGQVDILVKGRKVNELKDGQFIGEMSFLSNLPATADVVSLHPTELVVWKQKALKELVGRNPNLIFSLQAAMGAQLTLALKNKNETL